jgi:nucleoside phosphorylase
VTTKRINSRSPEFGILACQSVAGAAARLLVDDPAPEPSVGTDPNHCYYSGWMPSSDRDRPHRVVVAFPAKDGLPNATALVTDLARAYPDLIAIVSFGIAAGTTETRLGDIVSASRGVVDHSHVSGAGAQNSFRHPTEGLSPILRRADRDIEVGEHSDRRPWLDLIRHYEPKMPPHLRRPPHGTRRKPCVHRGPITIAGRHLPRDATKRDRFFTENSIIAVVRETPDYKVPWFEVRGISNWDSCPTNTDWHGYAAFVAAAYTRALLAHVQPLGAVPNKPTNGDLGILVTELLALDAMGDDRQRRAVISVLPDEIRGAVPDNPTPRLHVISIIQACQRFPDGMTTLVETLQVATGDSPQMDRVRSIVDRSWR